MSTLRSGLIAAIFVVACASSLAHGATIDFESVPGSSPSDQLEISNQYEADFGVTFSLSAGDGPYLEKVGEADAGSAFYNDATRKYDEAASGYESQLGEYFLRLGTDGLSSGSVPSLIISYTTPVKAASAQIWDIDANAQVYEQWDVKALNASSVEVDSDSSGPGILYSDPSALDGKPWLWSFSHAVADISFIEISYSGTKTSGIGLAFDNFSPSQAGPDVIPEPCTMALLGVGLLGMAVMKGKSRKNRTA